MATTSTPLLSRIHAAGAGLSFTIAVMVALAANFIWASGHDQQRCIELVILGLALAVALARGALSRAAQAFTPPQAVLCLTFLALGAASTVFSVSPGHALAEWSMFVLLGLASLVIAAEVAAAGTPGMYRLLPILAAICALYALRLLLAYGAALAAGVQLNFQTLAIGFSNARFLNHAQTALLPMLVLLARPRALRMPARLCFTLAAFWWALVFVSEARATVLALLIGAGVAWLLLRRRAQRWLLTLAASALAGLLVYAVLFIAVPLAFGMSPLGAPDNILARSAADPVSGRQFLWTRALALIVRHPLLGVGPQHFAHFGSDLQTGAHPHDWLFQIATEWGVPALLCLLALLLMGARALKDAMERIGPADAAQHDVAATLVAALAAILVDGLFSGVLVMPQSQLAIVLVFGMAIGWVRSLEPAPLAAATPRRPERYLAPLLGVLALGIALAVIGPDLGRKWEGAPLDAQEQAHNRGTHWPRLWEAGYF